MDKITVESLVRQFYEEQARYFPSSYTYKSALGYVAQLLPGVTLAEFRRRKQEGFIASLRGEGLADGTIKRMMAVIGRAVQRAYEYDLIDQKPYIMSVQSNVHRERVLTDDEARTLVEGASREMDKRLVTLAFCTAARPQALIELSTAQFDLGRRILDLNPPGRVQNARKHRPTIPLCNSLYGACQGWMGDRWVIHRDHHKLANARTIAERLPFPEGCSLYTIRHSVATELRSQGVPEMDVSAFLGHQPPGVSKTTLGYAKYRPEFMRKAADAVDAYWARIVGATCQT